VRLSQQPLLFHSKIFGKGHSLVLSLQYQNKETSNNPFKNRKMMKQMKLFTVALMCMMMQTMVCNANHDVMISVSQLPSAAKTFVQKQFPGKKILYAQQDGNFKAKFETRLDDGTEIEFDRIGNWEK